MTPTSDDWLAYSFASHYLHPPTHSSQSASPDVDTSKLPAFTVHYNPHMQTINEDKEVKKFYSAPENDGTPLSEPITPPRRGQSELTKVVTNTPIGNKLANAARNPVHNSYKEAAVVSFLDTSLRDKMTRNYPPADFIESVWGLNRDTIKAPPGGYQLAKGPLALYIKGSYDKTYGVSVERTAYAPFLEILDNLVAQIRVTMKDVPGLFDNGLQIISNWQDKIVQGHFAALKPDFLLSWLMHTKKSLWWLVTAIVGEFKKKALATIPEFSTTFDVDLLKKVQGNVARPEADASPANQTSHPSTSSSSSTVVSVVDTETTRRATSSGTSGKRKASTPARPEPKSKRQKSNPTEGELFSSDKPVLGHKFEANELQIVTYINELGSHGVRSYSTGFLVEDYTMSLWYIDHMGLVKGTSFNWLQQPHFLVYFLASVIYADFSNLGFFPLLKFPERTGSALTMKTFSGVKLELPNALAADDDLTVLGKLGFQMDVSAKRQPVWAYGMVGRSTTLVPIKPDPGDAAATTLCGKDAVVAKISWPLDSDARDPEDRHIRVIRTRLRKNAATQKLLANIVDLKCSMSLTLQDLDVPRTKMTLLEHLGLPKDSHRLCRVLVMKEYKPLASIGSPDEFKTVFVDVVRAHHAVYTETKILHRDISINNVMFYYAPDPSKNGGQRAVGVLCDFDLAKELPEPGIEYIMKNLVQSDAQTANVSPRLNKLEYVVKYEPITYLPSGAVVYPLAVASTDNEEDGDSEPAERRQPQFRTGTGPFMAMDILHYLQPPAHLYRHDLESFFWLLVWFTIAYNSKKKTVGEIKDWCDNNFTKVAASKAEFLSRPHPLLESANNEEYQEIRDTWVARLRMMLFKPLHFKYATFVGEYTDQLAEARKGELRREERERNQDDAGSDVEDGFMGDETVDEVLEDLRALVVERERIVTYESFMKAIRQKL